MIGDDDPREYGSTRSGRRETPSKLRYIVSCRSQLDEEEDEAELDALVAEIQPEILLLVVKMMRRNVNGGRPSLVSSLDPILHWLTLLLVFSKFMWRTTL